jgi:hypothetical protein
VPHQAACTGRLTSPPGGNIFKQGRCRFNKHENLAAQLVRDAQGDEFKGSAKAGIVDATKVARSALQHAASVGSLNDLDGSYGDGTRANTTPKGIQAIAGALAKGRQPSAIGVSTMADSEPSDREFDRVTARLLQREALRRAAEELNTTSAIGLESVLARISAEVTAEAADRLRVDAPAKPTPA